MEEDSSSENPPPIDNEKTLKKKVKELVKLIQNAKHTIIFTGAGISTSAGIPDFRGTEGVRTLAEKGLSPKPGVASIQAMATPTHMAIAALIEKGIVKYLISQNVDGLHRKSGIHPDFLSELHGNNTMERCPVCKKEYIRDFKCIGFINKHGQVDHRTGRICSVAGCNGELVDSIINFNEQLPEVPLEKAWNHTQDADLCIVLGSSLTVVPAADMPKEIGKKKNKNLVICNLLSTPLDSLASLRIYANCDDLMVLLMKQLSLEIPPFILERILKVTRTTSGWLFKSSKLTFDGIDKDGTPMSFLRGIEIRKTESEESVDVSITEPFIFEVSSTSHLTALFCFMGNYNEPPLKWSIPTTDGIRVLKITYSPSTGTFEMKESH